MLKKYATWVEIEASWPGKMYYHNNKYIAIWAIYMDNISFTVIHKDVKIFCKEIHRWGKSRGCNVNPHKTQILTSCSGASVILNIMMGTNTQLAMDIQHTKLLPWSNHLQLDPTHQQNSQLVSDNSTCQLDHQPLHQIFLMNNWSRWKWLQILWALASQTFTQDLNSSHNALHKNYHTYLTLMFYTSILVSFKMTNGTTGMDISPSFDRIVMIVLKPHWRCKTLTHYPYTPVSSHI